VEGQKAPDRHPGPDEQMDGQTQTQGNSNEGSLMNQITSAALKGGGQLPPLPPPSQLRHWQNKYRDILSIAILFHDKYR